VPSGLLSMPMGTVFLYGQADWSGCGCPLASPAAASAAASTCFTGLHAWHVASGVCDWGLMADFVFPSAPAIMKAASRGGGRLAVLHFVECGSGCLLFLLLYAWPAMIIDDAHYDMIVIGSGAAGAPWRASLAPPKAAGFLILGAGRLPWPLEDQKRFPMSISFRGIAITPVQQWFRHRRYPFKTPRRSIALGRKHQMIWGAVH